METSIQLFPRNNKNYIFFIEIVNPSQKIVEALTNLSLPSGVSIEGKMV